MLAILKYRWSQYVEYGGVPSGYVVLNKNKNTVMVLYAVMKVKHLVVMNHKILYLLV